MILIEKLFQLITDDEFAPVNVFFWYLKYEFDGKAL